MSGQRLSSVSLLQKQVYGTKCLHMRVIVNDGLTGLIRADDESWSTYRY